MITQQHNVSAVAQINEIIPILKIDPDHFKCPAQVSLNKINKAVFKFSRRMLSAL